MVANNLPEGTSIEPTQDGRLAVLFPYNDGVVRSLQKLGGQAGTVRMAHARQEVAWIVGPEHEAAVRRLLRKAFRPS